MFTVKSFSNVIRDRDKRRHIRQLSQPKKLLKFLGLRLAYRLKLKKVLFLPDCLDVEPNNTCNFRCPHCQVTHWTKEPSYLKVDSFKHILDQVSPLRHIKLQGMGEPLLNKQIIELLREGEARGIAMSFLSNGSVLTDKIAEHLLELDNTVIWFSVDGATTEVFEKIRVGGKLEKVKANIKNLTKRIGSKQSSQVKIWTVVTQENLHELADIVRLSKELSADSICLQVFLSSWGKDNMKKYVDPVQVECESVALSKSLIECRRVAEEHGINLRIYRNNLLSRKNKCVWPWTSAFIASNGDVVPCCIIANSDTVKMGNVFEEDFSRIWNNKKYQKLRDMIRHHDLPNYCKNCYVDA